MLALYQLSVFIAIFLVILFGIYCEKKNWKVAKIGCYILIYLIILFFL